MKKLIFFVSLILTAGLNAQTYLISFSGTGASSSVGSVLVENLKSGSSMVLNGDDVLRLSITTGINTSQNSLFSDLRIFPNPSSGMAWVEFVPPVSEIAQITINDMAGKVLAQVAQHLDNSKQEFRISGLNKGFFFINIKGKSYQISGKLLNTESSAGEISIDQVRPNNNRVSEKDSEMVSKGIAEIIDMQYSTGDRLKFTGISGNYRTIKMEVPTQDKSIVFNFVSCIDGDNNSYPVVEIGTQVWMAANLKTTKYSNGTSIPFVNTTNGWDILVETDKAFCYLQDNASNGNIYGALYTWAAAMNGASSSNLIPSGVQGACPTGWHLPGMDEWTSLFNYLGGSSLAGGKMKETGTSHWSNNFGATNESGFTALPGGFRDDWAWFGFNVLGGWWSATFENTTRAADASSIAILNINNNKKYGFSVRCLKN